MKWKQNCQKIWNLITTTSRRECNCQAICATISRMKRERP